MNVGLQDTVGVTAVGKILCQAWCAYDEHRKQQRRSGGGAGGGAGSGAVKMAHRHVLAHRHRKSQKTEQQVKAKEYEKSGVLNKAYPH